jgi:hypothetical protein
MSLTTCIAATQNADLNDSAASKLAARASTFIEA